MRRAKLALAPKLPELPDIGEQIVPGWRLTRHIVNLTLGILGVVLIAGVVAGVLATVDVTEDGDGVLEPVVVWPVRPVEGGILAQVLVRTGDTVSARQVLARLDSTAAVASIAELEALMAAARADLSRVVRGAPIEHQRLAASVAEADARVSRARTALRERMVEVGVSGDPDSIARAARSRVHVILDGASADLLAAQASLSSAEAQLSSSSLAPLDVERKDAELRRLEAQLVNARRRLGRLSILAPAPGIVLTEQTPSLVGASVAPGETFLELGDPRGWRALLAITERAVYRIRPGDQASVEIPALSAMPNNRFRGHVVSVGWQLAESSSAASNGSTPPGRGYQVLLALDQQDLLPLGTGVLRRGYAVHAKIITRSAHPAELVRDYFRERARGLAH